MIIRPMTMDDSDFMLELKNDPQTRQFAIVSHDEIKMEDHIKWLEKNLMWFSVIESYSGTRIGAFRYFGYEVSIWIVKEFRGLGVAERALKVMKYPVMMAKIVDGNISSMRAFIKAGFLPTSHVDNFYILHK